MFSSPSRPSDFEDSGIDHTMLSQLIAALLDRIECGVLACDSSGMLYHANLAAQRELAGARILRMVDGRVACGVNCLDTWMTALHDATVRARSSLISLVDAGERLMVAIMPVAIGNTDKSVAVALMGRRAVCSPLGLEMLSNCHRLTNAERRVLRALIDNATAREIAAAHGTKVATVRTQIQSVRDKLGVRSIDALLLRAAEVPLISARH